MNINYPDLCRKQSIRVMTRIPVHIVSGFLGSGKTTFLKEILVQLPPELKVGIIQNEFAPVNVDGKELQQSGKEFHLLEVNNGSLFCVCLLGEFKKSLAGFIEAHSPDLLVLEASGVSDTTSVAEIFSDPLLSGKIYLASLWCVVDAFNYLKAGKMGEHVHRQIRMADILVVNKTDKAGEVVPEIVQQIRMINPFAEIRTTSYCKTPFLPGQVAANRFFRVTPGTTGRPDIQSMVLKTSRKISSAGLLRFLNLWSPQAYRIKGYVVTADEGLLAVQCTGGETEVRKVNSTAGITVLIALTDQFSLREWNRSYTHHLGEL